MVKGDDIGQVDLQEELLFNLLAGEFAGVRGDMAQSIDYYSAAAQISNDAQVIVRAAYIALYAEEYERALALTNRWMALGLPESATVERIRIVSFLHLEQLEPSLAILEKNISAQGDMNEVNVAPIGNILSKEASPAFAGKVLLALNARHPDEPRLLMLLAKYEASVNELEAALGYLNQINELDEDLADAYLIKAQVLVALDRFEPAMDSIAIAVTKRPQDTQLRIQYGRMLVQMKAFDQAFKQFKILQNKLPDNENILLSLGLLSIELEQNQQAKAYLQALLDKGYHNPQAYYYLGRIQENEGEVMAAISSYERVQSGEYWLDARIRSASLLAKEGDTEAALSKLEILSHRDQSDNTKIQVYLARGEVLRSASRNKEAYSLYSTALQLSPENTELLYARALTAEKLDLLDVTESDLKTVIKHEPENASALNALGYTLADRTERLNEAREYIMKAALLLPDDPAILDSLGWVYYRLGQYGDAIKWLSKAFENLQDAEIAAHLGEVLWMDGQIEAAQKIWTKGKELNGNQAMLKATIERLKK